MDPVNNPSPPPAPKRSREFHNLMTRREKIAGWIWLPLHIVILPQLIAWAAYLLMHGRMPDDLTLNAWYYLLGLVFLLVTQFKFFRENYRIFTTDFRNALVTMLLGFVILMVCGRLISILTALFGQLPSSPNQEAVETLAGVDMRRMAASAVIMAPIVEEALFRGMIFGSIRPKSRVLAYVVSMVVFALYHVWSYAIMYRSLTPLVSGAAYLPIAFVLCFCYDRTESIWTPIFFHMFYNALALSVM